MLNHIGLVMFWTSIALATSAWADEPDQIVFQGAGWTVAAMRQQASFLGCYASKDFASGTRFVFARYRDDRWMGLVGEHGGRADHVGRVSLAVDGKPVHLADVSSNAKHIGRLGQISDETIKALADGYALTLSSAEGLFTFSLSGSEDALNKTLACVDYFKGQEKVSHSTVYSVLSTVSDGVVNMRSGPGVEFPVLLQIPAGTGNVLPSETCLGSGWCRFRWGNAEGWLNMSGLKIGGPQPATSPPQSPSQDVAYVQPDEATKLLSGILDDAKTVGYRIHPPKSGSAIITFSLGDGTVGSFAAARGRDTKDAETYASSVIARWASNCGGEFLSGKQPVPSTNGSVIRKITTTCRESEGNYVTDTVVVRKQSGFLIEFAQTYPASAELPSGENTRKRGALTNAVMQLP